MKSWMCVGLLLVCLRGTWTRFHSLKFFDTLSAELPNVPELAFDWSLDDVPIVHYDSDASSIELKQDWMDRVDLDDPGYWDRKLKETLEIQQIIKADMGVIKEVFGHAGGVFVVQVTYGCEWDNETGVTSSFDNGGYNGEDFLYFDLETETWVAARPQAAKLKQSLDAIKDVKRKLKEYLTHRCPFWLHRYVEYGSSYVTRTELPSVSLLQKTSSSPVRCLATGFYPKTASLVWRRDGVEIHEDVEHGEILPNQDGTFQMSVDLDVSSVRAEDWGRVDCVFQLSGVEEDMVTILDKDKIRTNWDPSDATNYTVLIAVTVGVGVSVLLLVLAAVAGLVIWRKRRGPETGSESAERLNPESLETPSEN